MQDNLEKKVNGIGILEKIENAEEIKKQFDEVKEELVMPLLALRGKVLFPKTLLNFDVGRPASIEAVNRAAKIGSKLFISAQKDAFIDAPKESDLSNVGVIALLKQIVKLPNGSMKISAEAICRAKILEFIPDKACFMVKCEKAPYIEDEDEIKAVAYTRVAKASFFEYALFDKRITKEVLSQLNRIETPNEFMDNALSVVNFKESDLIDILAEDVTLERINKFKTLFTKETEIARLEKKLSATVKNNIDKSQKEFYLREQLRAIHQELGDNENERDELTEKIKNKGLPKEIEEKALKEIERLGKINPSSPDYSIILNYLDWICELPFETVTTDTENLADAKAVLDADHFGLEKVKQRIVEYLAVLHLTKKIKGPILCFVGPPGVGKTSVATSIARALNRKFVRMSLGGVKDEAEIRGHRKTYVGAMPGRIIYGLKNAGSMNPVFLLDEIDKLSSDIHGDPASALLEVLDPEQNVTFRDRYLEVPVDLSKVMFITTANSLDTIPYPLLDRMEVIELTGYTDEDKLQIAKQYLIPKQIKENGLTDGKVTLTDDAVKEIIEGYTMEAGVRNLDREVASVIRKVAARFAEKPRTKKQTIDKKDISKYLGVKKFLRDESDASGEVGACTGLAWTSVGGTTLTIEVSLMRGKGEILLTGKLGDVMKESARAAISYIRANAEKYGIAEERFEKTDIHIHVPEGATPKDGPSAGITMATAILSAFTGKAVKQGVAMTGEITLRGKVLAIGGLKEKSLAAYRRGIKNILIPKANVKDLEEIPKEVKKHLNFIPCDSVEQVFDKAIDLK